jgi:transketolase
MKTAFIKTLTLLMENNDDIVVVTADMGFSVFEDIAIRFPDRFFNTGITEQASVSFAAGLALSGYTVYFYAQAVFSTMRCFEQVRLDVAYNYLNIKIIGTNAGYSLNQLGASHFSVEDVGLMRLLPNITIFTPGDPEEMKWALNKTYEIEGPTYLRFSKLGSEIIHNNLVVEHLGNPILISKGKDAALFISGGMLKIGLEIKNSLLNEGINLSVYSVPVIKPLPPKIIIDEVQKTHNIFTLEEHSVLGGLGTIVSEIIAENSVSTIFYKFGFPDKYTSVAGSLEFLMDYNGISVKKISKIIRDKINNKKVDSY